MSKELLNLVVLVDQGIEVNRSQIEHCQNMQKIIEESIMPDMEAEHILAAGAILGWGLGSSAVYVAQNMDKLINILDKLEIDLDDLRSSNQPHGEGPGIDISAFVENYLEKASQQMKALEKIKSYLLSDAFDDRRLERIYSEKGRGLLEADWEADLKRLLED